MWSKRNIILIVCVMVLYLGTMLFGMCRKDTSKAENARETVSPSPAYSTEVSPALEAVSGPGFSPGSSIVSESESKEGKETETERETREWEELYPDGMDVSDIPEDILELLHVTAEEMSERVRIFANGQGMAGMEEVYCYGEDTVEQEKGTVSVPLYFSVAGKDGEEETRYNFEYIFYKETGEYCIQIW